MLKQQQQKLLQGARVIYFVLFCILFHWQVWRRAISMYVSAIVEEIEEDTGEVLFERVLSTARQ